MRTPTFLGRRLAGILRAAAPLVLALAAACGSGDTMVIVQVSGLDTTITQLNVTIQLDGALASPSKPSGCSDSRGVFEVCEQKERFGIDIPTGTQRLDLTVDAVDTNRQPRKRGQGSLDLRSGSLELPIVLNTL